MNLRKLGRETIDTYYVLLIHDNKGNLYFGTTLAIEKGLVKVAEEQAISKIVPPSTTDYRF